MNRSTITSALRGAMRDLGLLRGSGGASGIGTLNGASNTAMSGSAGRAPAPNTMGAQVVTVELGAGTAENPIRTGYPFMLNTDTLNDPNALLFAKPI